MRIAIIAAATLMVSAAYAGKAPTVITGYSTGSTVTADAITGALSVATAPTGVALYNSATQLATSQGQTVVPGQPVVVTVTVDGANYVVVIDPTGKIIDIDPA